MIEDEILVIRCRQRSQQALTQIYKKYRDKLLILGIALSNNEALAEDALHDTFVRFAQQIQSFKLKGNLKSYLSVCMANRIRDLQRSGKSKKAVSLDEANSHIANTPKPSEQIVRNEQLDILAKALVQLPTEQREVIALRIYCQMAFSKIAQMQEVSVNTVKGRY
ncbi:MAG: sigma-70 family RNA polymerase sigma factor [Phycisphaerae bacterium]|nr:sigma-70 family RNA polymerase sigma factor [Phycisphaerae bacterium]